MFEKWRIYNFWPPFLFSGIKIASVENNFRDVIVRLKLRFWNKNYVGTAFGGSIYAMADPFYMLILIKNLGSEYIVWDKAASIKYIRPGKSDLTAIFHVSEKDIEHIREVVAEHGKMLWEKQIEVKDNLGEVIAVVHKSISIKKKTSNTVQDS